MMSLAVTPINLDEANAFVEQHHRHHKPVPGAKFCVAVSKDDEVRGVAIVGRPVSRHKSLITYTMESEGGASLRGAGWRCVGKATTRVGQGWNVRSRPRVDTHPLQQKLKWEVC